MTIYHPARRASGTGAVCLTVPAISASAPANATTGRSLDQIQGAQGAQPSVQAPASFDWRAFLAEHWSSTFGPLFAAHHLDTAEVDSEVGRRLAVTWRAVLDEQAQLGDGACGVAHGRWMALLRQIKDDQDQGTGHYLRRA